MNIRAEIEKLGLPENSFIVVGSGIMQALNIRSSDDIDIVVSQSVFDHLEKTDWIESRWGDHPVFKKGVFELGTSWEDLTIEKLLPKAVVIDGIPYLSLEDLRKWKLRTARPKDLQDIDLIDAYLAQQ